MINQLTAFFNNQGYKRATIDSLDSYIFIRKENFYLNLINIIDITKSAWLDSEYNKTVLSAIKNREFKELDEIHSLTLVISDDLDKALSYCDGDRFRWVILQGEDNQLLIPEGSVEDFYGLRGEVEGYLNNPVILDEHENDEYYNEKGREYKKIADMPIVNIVLVGINVIIFIACTIWSDLIYDAGVTGVIHVIHNGEWYREITAMFLHADIYHLFSNMIVLYFLGEIVEEEMGHIKYFILYMLSGFGGGVTSLGFNYLIGDTVESLGASGAVFGMMGALVWLLMRNKWRLESMSMVRVMYLVGSSIIFGIMSSNVDNAAHFGGLIAGFILAIILYRKKKMKGNFERETQNED